MTDIAVLWLAIGTTVATPIIVELILGAIRA